MSLIAPVVDGKIKENTAASNSSESTKSSSTALDKQAFLQLLVAQMKYQDPLEPTDNTEYISQLATFSTLEEMQNMRSSIDLQRASSLVGQEVTVKTTDTNGETNVVHGFVDYVVYENGKAYLSIDEQLYSIDDLYSEYDKDYSAAYDKAYVWSIAYNKLPGLNKVTLDNESAIEELWDEFSSMNDYEKTFIAQSHRTGIEEYHNKIISLKEQKEKQEADEETERRLDELEDAVDRLLTDESSTVGTKENSPESVSGHAAAESSEENDGAYEDSTEAVQTGEADKEDA